jgi:hypothetical protein
MFNKRSIKNLVFVLTQLFMGSFVVCFAALSDPPELSSLVDIARRTLNIAVMVSGIVLVAIIAYGVWKSSMATGDPRGLEGAKQTWTYALYGFLIVVAFFSIFIIITSALGITLSPGALLTGVSGALNALINPK